MVTPASARLWIFALALLVHPEAEAGRPTHAALRKAFESSRRAVVEVIGPKRSGPGVIVGAGGQVLTSVQFVGLEEARVRLEGAELPARVVLADAWLKISVVQLEPSERAPLPSAAVRVTDAFAQGDWLVGIRREGSGALAPLAGQVLRGPSAAAPFIETDLPLPPGSPLVDLAGRLVAISVQQRGKWGSRALPIGPVKRRLAPDPEPVP